MDRTAVLRDLKCLTKGLDDGGRKDGARWWVHIQHSGKYCVYGKYHRCYKSSAPRAADAARHGRASKNTTQCEGGRMKRPMIGFS